MIGLNFNPKSKPSRMLDDFVTNLQAEDLTPRSVSNHDKVVKALFRCNELKLELSYNLPERSVYEDRTPTPEELKRLLDIGDLHERVIINVCASYRAILIGQKGMRGSSIDIKTRSDRFRPEVSDRYQLVHY